MDDHDVERSISKWKRLQRCHLNVHEHARLRRRGLRTRTGMSIVDGDCRMPAQSRLRSDRPDEGRIVDANLQNTLTHAHATHDDRQRFERGLAKEKHAIFLMI